MLTGNAAGVEGGGLYFRQGFTAENIPVHITRTTFENNTATQAGGGAYLPQPALVEGSIFRGNTSLNAAGGGLALLSGGSVSSRVSNTVFFGNHASLGGASVYINSIAPLEILHTTLAGSGAASEQGISVVAADVQITNTIIVSHTVGIAASGGAVVTADHTLFHGNQTDVQGVTNLNSVYGDPQFLDLPGGDFHLTLGSPAIDAGATTSITTDFEADLRPIITQADLGADEFGDSAMIDPGASTVITSTVGAGREIIIRLPPGAVGGWRIIRLLPTPQPTKPPPAPRLPAGMNFTLQVTQPLAQTLSIAPAFLLPIEITLTYRDVDVAGLDENSLFLAVFDETTGEWVDATTTCTLPGSITRNTGQNQITVTTCATGEFALLGSEKTYQIFLPLVTR
jgi:hypothetical protein